MGRFLHFIWFCKVVLTGASAWRYCSESIVSPFCWISGVYSLVLAVALVVPWNGKPAMATLEEQETLRLKLLEEGWKETVEPFQQNQRVLLSKRQREDSSKEKSN